MDTWTLHTQNTAVAVRVCARLVPGLSLCVQSPILRFAQHTGLSPHTPAQRLWRKAPGVQKIVQAPHSLAAMPGSKTSHSDIHAWCQIWTPSKMCVSMPHHPDRRSRGVAVVQSGKQHGTKRSYSRRNTHQLQLPDQKKGHTPCRAGALIGNRAGNKQDAHTWTCIRSEMKRPRCHTTTGSQQQISATRLLLFAGHTPPIWPAQARKYLQAAVAAASNVSLVHADNMHSLRPCPWSPAPCGAAGSVPLVYMYRHASAIPTARVCPTQLTRCPLMRCLLQSCEQTAATVVSTLTCPAHR